MRGQTRVEKEEEDGDEGEEGQECLEVKRVKMRAGVRGRGEDERGGEREREPCTVLSFHPSYTYPSPPLTPLPYPPLPQLPRPRSPKHKLPAKPPT